MVGDRRKVLELVAHPEPGPTDLAELVRAADKVPLAAGHVAGKAVALPAELLHVQVGQLGLGVERVDVRGPALHEQEDAGLRLRRVVRRLGRERPGKRRGRFRRLGAEHRVERHRAERRTESIEKVAAGRTAVPELT
jgi:hypothetical protein